MSVLMSALVTILRPDTLTPLLRLSASFGALVSLDRIVVFDFGLGFLFVTTEPDGPVAGLVLAYPGFVSAFFVWGHFCWCGKCRKWEVGETKARYSMQVVMCTLCDNNFARIVRSSWCL